IQPAARPGRSRPGAPEGPSAPRPAAAAGAPRPAATAAAAAPRAAATATAAAAAAAPTFLTRRVIPCLDVASGRAVEGARCLDLAERGAPPGAAARSAARGAAGIVSLDVTAAPEGRDTDLDWVRRTAERVFIPLTVGGGVRSAADGGCLLRAGADKVAVN